MHPLRKRFWPRFFWTVTGIAALGLLAIISYLQHPVFGELPSGEQLVRIERSPNQTDHTFRNQIDTPMRTTDQPEWSMWLGTLFGSKGQTRPPEAVPALKTDLKALDREQDLVVWLGHSSYFVQLGGQRILIDPVFSTNAAPVMRAIVAFDGTNLYGPQDVPEIDVLLITHDHYDHLDYPTIRAMAPQIRHVVAGLGVGAHFQAWGYDSRKIHEADWFETIATGSNLQIHVTPARHFSGRELDRDRTLWVGFALTSAQHRLFFSGDSGYGPHFAEIGRRYGTFDWVTLDMGQYDPRWANVHMTPEQAAQAADDLGTLALTPGHVGRFSIAPHDWDDPFKRIVAASSQHSYALWTPVIGQPIYLDGQRQEFSSWWEAVKPD